MTIQILPSILMLIGLLIVAIAVNMKEEFKGDTIAWGGIEINTPDSHIMDGKIPDCPCKGSGGIDSNCEIHGEYQPIQIDRKEQFQRWLKNCEEVNKIFARKEVIA